MAEVLPKLWQTREGDVRVSSGIEASVTMLLAGVYVLVRTWIDGEDGARVAGIILVVLGLVNTIARTGWFL